MVNGSARFTEQREDFGVLAEFSDEGVVQLLGAVGRPQLTAPRPCPLNKR